MPLQKHFLDGWELTVFKNSCGKVCVTRLRTYWVVHASRRCHLEKPPTEELTPETMGLRVPVVEGFTIMSTVAAMSEVPMCFALPEHLMEKKLHACQS